VWDEYSSMDIEDVKEFMIAHYGKQYHLRDQQQNFYTLSCRLYCNRSHPENWSSRRE